MRWCKYDKLYKSTINTYSTYSATLTPTPALVYIYMYIYIYTHRRAHGERLLRGQGLVHARAFAPGQAPAPGPLRGLLRWAQTELGVPRAGPLQARAPRRHVRRHGLEGLQLRSGRCFHLQDGEARRRGPAQDIQVRHLPLVGR